MRRLALAILLAACSGGGGVQAPPLGPTTQACNDLFCLDYPADWVVDIGADYLALEHPGSGGRAVATVGNVDMQGLQFGAGGQWPAPVDEVSESFWELLGQDQDVALDGLDILEDGSVRTNGNFEDRRMWHRLIPVDGPRAVGVEVRAPNRSWDSHALAILDGVSLVTTGAP